MKQYLQLKPLAKKDKGTAGLTILLSLIVMLFVIGLIVMIFTIMSNKMQTQVSGDNTSIKVINDTGTSIAGVTTWFGLFITVGAMVVLILLTVIIITAIRSSGMVSEGTA